MSENRRTGKIARLPAEIRKGVNQRLMDGEEYRKIIDWLTSGGHPGVIESNLTHWHQGGYVDWLREQSRLETMKAKREFALEIVRENTGSTVHEAGLQLAASQLFELLEDFDPGPLKELLAEQPEHYASIVNSIAKISREALGFERFKAEVKAKLEEMKVATDKGGLTKATIEKIERELRLL